MFDIEFINCEYTWLTHEAIMAARIFCEREIKQTRACAAHDSVPLILVSRLQNHKTKKTWFPHFAWLLPNVYF